MFGRERPSEGFVVKRVPRYVRKYCTLPLHAQERVHHPGVQLGAGEGADMFADLFLGNALPVGSVLCDKSIPDIGNGKDACCKRDLLTLEIA